MNYYTYIYYDPSRNNEPIYVGKGTAKRAWRHLIRKDKHPFVQRLQLMAKNNIKPVIGIYAGFDEDLALLVEEELISKFGRKDLGRGPLLNLTDGGDGTAGYKHTEEQKSLISDGNKNKIVSKETRDRISKSHNTRTSYYKPTEEEKEKMSKMMKGRYFSDETKSKISAAKKGKPWTDAQRLSRKIK